MSVKIIHTADIHLDAPFAAFSPAGAEKKRDTLRKSFLKLLKKAEQEGTQLFFISGDLFDSEFATKDTAQMLKSAFAALPSCLFFISPGNHDPFTPNSVYATTEFTDNVHVFRERQCVELAELGVRVYGYGFVSSLCEECTVSGFEIPDDNMVNILVAHGDMSSPMSANGPVSKKNIGESGFDYVALGHIHKSSGIQIENGVTYAYPGCLCGRSFDETGEKTAFIGTIEKGNINLDTVSVAEMRFETVSCDVSDSLSRRDALERMSLMLKDYPENVSVRLVATGNTKEEFVFAPDELLGQTGCKVTIVDNTRPVLNLTVKEQENTLKGVFYRMMTKRIKQAEADSEQYKTLVKALKYGMAVLEDRNITDFGEDEK